LPLEVRQPAEALERQLDLPHAPGDRHPQRGLRRLPDDAVWVEAVSGLEPFHGRDERLVVLRAFLGHPRAGRQVAEGHKAAVQVWQPRVPIPRADRGCRRRERRQTVVGGEGAVLPEPVFQRPILHQRRRHPGHRLDEALGCERRSEHEHEIVLIDRDDQVEADRPGIDAAQVQVPQIAEHRGAERELEGRDLAG
jgi:hypothetical protein